MDDSKYREIIFLQSHGMCAWKYYNLHLGIPYSKVGTDGINIIIPVLKWKILPFNTNSSRIRAMEDSI